MYRLKPFPTPSDYLREIDKSLDEKRQISYWNASHQDKIYLNAYWVMNANQENPGLNLKVINSVNDFPEHIKTMINTKQKSARFIVFFSDQSYHALAFDCCYIPDKGVSILGIEPADSIKSETCQQVAIACQKLDFSVVGAPIFLRILSSNQQNSTGECVIYSLSLVKKMYKENKRLFLLHQKNLDNKLNDTHKKNNIVIYPPVADKYLLPVFMKHCQSEKRMKNYLSTPLAGFYSDIDKRTFEVSKNKHSHESKPLTLHERFSHYCMEQKVGEGDDEDDIKRINASNSIFEKRRHEVSKLFKK